LSIGTQSTVHRMVPVVFVKCQLTPHQIASAECYWNAAGSTLRFRIKFCKGFPHSPTRAA
jgi:hypothetical protein